MSSRIADIAVPPRCREMIRAGALVAVNHSGGKDSQSMTILLSGIVPAGQLIAVHAPLAEVEWEGVVRHIEATLPAGVPLVMAPVSSGKSLLDRIEERGRFPGPRQRFCTGDFKRTPIERELRRYLKRNPHFGGRLVNAMGMRAEESPARARKAPWKRNDRMSVAGREVFDWLPVFALSTEDVFRVIRDAGQAPHWAYAAGMSRLSCSFCILASRADLRRAAELRPELYRTYAALERRIGHTLSPSGIPLPELTGISLPESGDGADPMGLDGLRTRPAPTQQRLARRSSVKPRCSRSGAEPGAG